MHRTPSVSRDRGSRGITSGMNEAHLAFGQAKIQIPKTSFLLSNVGHRKGVLLTDRSTKTMVNGGDVGDIVLDGSPLCLW